MCFTHNHNALIKAILFNEIKSQRQSLASAENEEITEKDRISFAQTFILLSYLRVGLVHCREYACDL